MKEKKRKCSIRIDEEYCKGCGICVRFCPKHIIKISDQVNSRGYYMPEVTDPEECTLCMNCDLFCPDFAVIITEEDE